MTYNSKYITFNSIFGAIFSCFFARLVIFDSHYEFYLVDAGYFCIPINIFDICSGMHLITHSLILSHLTFMMY